jgi:hypothetical protein
MRKIYFDMDGTIADLYGQENWLERLMNEEPELYLKAQPLIDMGVLRDKIEELQEKDIEVKVITWLAKNTSNNHLTIITEEKLEWLDNTGIEFDDIHIVKYGTEKHNIPKSVKGDILFDDNADVRMNWELAGGIAYNEKQIFEKLNEILRVE